MIDFSTVKENDRIKYIGDSLAYGGSYTVVTSESTYLNEDTMPDSERGRLMIIEFMNNGTPMFFRLDRLNPNDWRLE